MAAKNGSAPAEFQDWYNHLDARGFARYHIACVYGWDGAQYQCLVTLWTEESQWNHTLRDGIPQAQPNYKMAAAGEDWRTNPRTQVLWGTAYIDERYGAPTGTPRHCHAGY